MAKITIELEQDELAILMGSLAAVLQRNQDFVRGAWDRGASGAYVEATERALEEQRRLWERLAPHYF